MRVLVLNQNYVPLNVCHFRRAYVLALKGKAEILERHQQGIRTFGGILPRPLVIRLKYYVRRPLPAVKLSRREVFARDNHTCQYCGNHGSDLTIDHVLPRRLGGKRRWENLVSACKPCNRLKGGRTPREARMRLIRPPRPPILSVERMIIQRTNGSMDPSWAPFMRLSLEQVS